MKTGKTVAIELLFNELNEFDCCNC